MRNLGYAQEELISIIIPVYNVKEYIMNCINSVLVQSYSELEIILIDDGSNDGSEKICDELKKRDKRIKVIHQKNAGLSAARNRGLDAAMGEYIFFLDSDDMLHKLAIETLYIEMCSKNCDLVIGLYKKIYGDEIPNISEPLFYNDSIVKSGKDWLVERYKTNDGNISNSLVTAWGKLYKRSFFQELRYPIGKLHEDEFITYKILFYCKRVAVVSAQLYYYRQRDGSIMNNKKSVQNIKNTLEAFLEKKEFYAEKNAIELHDREIVYILNYLCSNEISVRNIQKNKEFANEMRSLFMNLYNQDYNQDFASVVQRIKFFLYKNCRFGFILFMKTRKLFLILFQE